MTTSKAGGTDIRKQLLSLWEERCRKSDLDPAPCASADALFLVSALAAALQHGGQTPQLGRAARSWGGRFTAPVEALAALAALREVVLEATTEPREGTWAVGLPVASESVNQVVDQLMLEAVDAASAKLRVLARTDALTGCANRLALKEDLARSISSAARSGLDLALAAIDLDGLKKINDTQGHAAGDAALKDLVARLRAALRDADQLYRTGGDEFVAVAPFTDEGGASAMLERATQAGGPSFSWGVASLREVGQPAIDDPEALVAAADKDLYLRRWRARDARDAREPRDSQVSATAPSLEALEARRKLSDTKKAEAIGVATGLPLGLSREPVVPDPTSALPRTRLGSFLRAARSSLFGAKQHRIAFVAIIASLMMATAVVAAPNQGQPPGVTQYPTSALPGSQSVGWAQRHGGSVYPSRLGTGRTVFTASPSEPVSAPAADSTATSGGSGGSVPLALGRSDLPDQHAVLDRSGSLSGIGKNATDVKLTSVSAPLPHVNVAQTLGIASTPASVVTHLTGSPSTPSVTSTLPAALGLPGSSTAGLTTKPVATPVPTTTLNPTGSTSPGSALPPSLASKVGSGSRSTGISTPSSTTVPTTSVATVGPSAPAVSVSASTGSAGAGTATVTTTAPTTATTVPNPKVTVTTPTTTVTTPSSTTSPTTTAANTATTAVGTVASATPVSPVPPVTPPEVTQVAPLEEATSGAL